MKPFNLEDYPHHSKRTVVCAKNGMVASSQPLASQAGLDILKQGGNAVDAAIAAAVCLAVVEPTSNGIGSDAFAIIWKDGSLHGINGSGVSPKNIDIQTVLSQGYETVPKYGWLPVTVPGAPGAWAELSKRFGVLPLQMVFSPAIEYAKDGFPVSPVTANNWKTAWKIYRTQLTGREFQPWFDIFAPEGFPPKAGQLWKSKEHAETLEQIAETEARSFYQGNLSEKIASFSASSGGLLTEEDLGNYQPAWVDPICVPYRGYDVWEMPPNTQGLITLLALNILEGFDLDGMFLDEFCHLQIEALKLAFTDGLAHISQESSMNYSVEDLLSPSYAEQRMGKIDKRASSPVAGIPNQGGTVYLAAADRDGTMVSFIQSNYMGFGSGLVVPGTGIALHNRGHSFSLDSSHVNRLEPSKQPYHTIIPGFITHNNEAIGPFGVMGGFMQPQGHLQILMNMIDGSLNPQAALDAPRWQWTGGKQVLLEHMFSADASSSLKKRGHQIARTSDTGLFGRGQIIWRDNKTGCYIGGTEPRTDGAIAAW